jgi:hypothetical protein
MPLNIVILIIAVVAWIAAMARLLPRAWRLDKHRRRTGQHRRAPLADLKLRALRLQALRA